MSGSETLIHLHVSVAPNASFAPSSAAIPPLTTAELQYLEKVQKKVGKKAGREFKVCPYTPLESSATVNVFVRH